MLNQLPHEIILHVFDYLSFRPKLSLAMTCRAFYVKLYNSKLFEDLEVLSKNKETVMNLLNSKNIDTSRIKTLHIVSPTQEDSRSTDMLPLFPNAQEFVVDNTHLYTYNPSTDEPLENLSYLKDTIKKHNNLHGFPVITQLLKVYTFPHLTSLCLEGSPADRTDKPLVCLKNTPNLISLELNSCRISIVFLEKLHDKCKRLQSLKLGRGTLDFVSQTLPELINPADELISFTSTLFVTNDVSCIFFRYIISKYPNLRLFDINNWLDMPLHHGLDSRDGSATYKAYRQRLPELMMNLLPKLTTLKIEPYLFNNFFDVITACQNQLDSLSTYSSTNRSDFFGKMKKSHEFLVTLNHLSSLTVEIKYAQYLCEKKYNHPNIRELHLFQSHAWAQIPTFELDKVFLTYNGLHTFVFRCPRVNITSGNIIEPIQHPHLKNFTINASMSTSDILKYVSQCLPNVANLSWRNSRTDLQSYEVNLPSHSLNVLNFDCDPIHRAQDDMPLFIYHIQKENITKTVEVFEVGENYNVKEKVETSTLDAESRRNTTFIKIACKNIRELHCGDLIIF